MSASSASSSAAPARGGAPRHFGRFQLLRLLGKSQHTMAWLVSDTRAPGDDLVLMLPRSTPQGEGALERWAQRARKAARLDHPNLAPAVEIGSHEGWPFVCYELGDYATLADRIGNKGLAPAEAAALVGQLLQALAFAHDAGVAHHDLQGFAVLVNDKGGVRLMGLDASNHDLSGPGGMDAAALRQQRRAAEADVLQVGILMHHVLTGAPALDEPDASRVAELLPPQGRDIVRLPFSTPRPIPEPLRVIVNRATDRQERQRYRSARTLASALEGWLQVEGSQQNGPLVLLLERMRVAGVLPALPGAAERAARLALMEKGRNDELAEVLLDDMALSFELLRVVNTAQLRSGQVSGAGPILTVRRAIAMLGLEGVRRVALALRPWPGPLGPEHAQDLARTMDKARRAGRVAMAIRPAGYDAEVVYLVTLLQNLGRLVVQYHFADEAAQIRRLMQPAPSADGEGEDPGMSEEAASIAVLGVDLESIGHAVARWWGMDDSVLHLMRRQSPGAPVRPTESDDERIRISASGAIEAVDAATQPAHHAPQALQRVVQRYGRALGLNLRDLQAALQPQPAQAQGGDAAAAPSRAAGPELRAHP